MIRHALAYAERLGWSVLPLHHVRSDGRCSCLASLCGSPGKHPRTRHGVAEASTDPSIIAEWWQRWPLANVGIAAGELWWALDVDGEAGFESLDRLEREHGDWAHDGPRCITGSGGYHLFFAPDQRVGNRVHFAPGLDTRGAGGYLVAAPSNHASGNRYRWLVPPRGALPAAPEWLILLVAPPPVRNTSRPPPPPVCELGSAAKRAECYIAAIEGGERHCGQGVSSRCFRVAQVLVRRFGLPRSEAFAMLRAWADRTCTPRWTDRELEHKLDSAEKQGAMRYGIEERTR
jgi:hypothetical protein